MPKVRIEKVKKIVPKKKNEFDLFLYVLENGEAMHLGKIAKALGVGPETLTEWKKDPRAIEAQTRGVITALKNMREVGSADWRMWKDKLAMAGIVETKETDITTNGKDLPTPIYGGLSGHDGNPEDISA